MLQNVTITMTAMCCTSTCDIKLTPTYSVPKQLSINQPSVPIRQRMHYIMKCACHAIDNKDAKTTEFQSESIISVI